MKLLFITYHYLNGKGGGVFASRAYINAFAEIADDMTLLYPMKDGAYAVDINPKVKTIPVWDRRGKIRKFFDMLTGRFNRYRHIQRYIGDNHYDMVVFDSSMVTRGVIGYFKRQGCKIITIHHNYQYEYFRDNSKHPTRIPTLFWSKIQEREAVRLSDLNLTLTKADKELLSQHYGNGKEKIEVLGTFEYNAQSRIVGDDIVKGNFLITGDLSAIQTEQSLIPWMNEYYPYLTEAFPDASVTLAGKSPSDRLRRIAEKHNINIIASPDDMAPILAQAKYYICPTSLGGGLKLRVMDGLKAGLPVLCHAVSARGYEIFVESGILFVYSDIASFIEQLKNIKNSRKTKKEIVELYEQEFSFLNGVSRLRKLLPK